MNTKSRPYRSEDLLRSWVINALQANIIVSPLTPQLDAWAVYRSDLEQHKNQCALVQARFEEANDKVASLNEELDKTT